MKQRVQSAICQRCGKGFIVTRNYLDMLERRGVRVAKPLCCPTCFLRSGAVPKERGHVAWFNPRRHYGFITAEDGDEVFFHEHQILGGGSNSVDAGRAVRFHVLNTAKGPAAHNVEVLED